MEDEEESPAMVPPVAASVESRINRKKIPSSMRNRGGRGRGRGRGSVAVKPTAPSASISTDTNKHLEPLAGDEDHAFNFDMNADISLSSVSTDGDADDDAADDASQVEVGVGDDVSTPSNPSNATRGRKGKRAGIQLSPSKVKVKRAKRAGCWKCFKEIKVQSEKLFGVIETKAKYRFCHKSYVYHQGGATSQLNRHLAKCTQFLNKLAKAKRQLAQGLHLVIMLKWTRTMHGNLQTLYGTCMRRLDQF